MPVPVQKVEMAKPQELRGLDGFGTVTTLAFFILVVAYGVSRRVYTAIKTIVSAPWFCVADVLTYNHISSLRGLLPLLPIFKSRVKRKDGRRIFIFLHSLWYTSSDHYHYA